MSLDFSPPQRKPQSESIVPMINVVFLLLIFFLMTAQIAPPEPFEVAPPIAQKAADPASDQTLYLSDKGVLQFQDSNGAAAIAALAPEGEKPGLILRADGAASGHRLAEVMADLRKAGFDQIELVVQQP